MERGWHSASSRGSRHARALATQTLCWETRGPGVPRAHGHQGVARSEQGGQAPRLSSCRSARWSSSPNAGENTWTPEPHTCHASADHCVFTTRSDWTQLKHVCKTTESSSVGRSRGAATAGSPPPPLPGGQQLLVWPSWQTAGPGLPEQPSCQQQPHQGPIHIPQVSTPTRVSHDRQSPLEAKERHVPTPQAPGS